MSQTISTISAKGKALVDESGKRFMIRGVALSPNSEDDLLGDNYFDYLEKYIVPGLLSLNINTIRVYRIDTWQNHKKAMDLLAGHNIYVMVALATNAVGYCVNRLEPSYSPSLYDRFIEVVSEFAAYKNTLAFSVGNEVAFPGIIYSHFLGGTGMTNGTIVEDAAVMKSLVRDVKAYIRNNQLRAIPVGMELADEDSNAVASWHGIGTDVVAEFYVGGNAAERADYIGINSYRYVNGADPGPMNAYDAHARAVAKFPVPVIISEMGGMDMIHPRDWAIVPQLYTSALLSQNLSGQVAFQFFNKPDNLGLFEEKPPVYTGPVNGEITLLAKSPLSGADALAAEFKKVSELPLPPMPTAVADPSGLPDRCNPSLKPSPAAEITVTIANYANVAIKAVQGGTVMADIQAGSGSKPTFRGIIINNTQDLLLQQNKGKDWIPVCKVPANRIKRGMVIKNDVAWGNDAMCNIS